MDLTPRSGPVVPDLGLGMVPDPAQDLVTWSRTPASDLEEGSLAEGSFPRKKAASKKATRQTAASNQAASKKRQLLGSLDEEGSLEGAASKKGSLAEGSLSLIS